MLNLNSFIFILKYFNSELVDECLPSLRTMTLPVNLKTGASYILFKMGCGIWHTVFSRYYTT